MKKIAAFVSLVVFAVPVFAAAETSDEVIANLLAALSGPVKTTVTATSSTSTAPAAPLPPAAPKPKAPESPDLIPSTLAPGYLFNIGGNAPQVDANAALKASLASLMAQYAVISKAATTTASSTPPAPKKQVFSRNLSVGARGADVSALQQILIDGLYLVGAPSGYFGILTKTAVIALQSDHALDATGFVGPKTRALLNTSDPKMLVHVQPADMTPQDSSSKTVRFSLLVTTPAPTATATTSAATSTATSTDPTSGGSSSLQSATSTATSTAPVPPAPVSVNLSVSPTEVPDGGSALATWSSMNSSFCTASGAWDGTLPVFGTAKIGPIHSTIDLILTCMGPGGEDSTTATVVLSGQQ